AVLASAAARADSVAEICNMVASPQGSEMGTGSTVSPFRTAQKLVDALSPGEVGCLRAGTYGGGLTFEHGGTAMAPIVLRSYPGGRALVTRRGYVPRGSGYRTVAHVPLDGHYPT